MASTIDAVALEVKRLDVRVGDAVEIAGRCYDVGSGKERGVSLESAISGTVEEIHAELGGGPLTSQSPRSTSEISPPRRGLSVTTSGRAPCGAVRIGPAVWREEGIQSRDQDTPSAAPNARAGAVNARDAGDPPRRG